MAISVHIQYARTPTPTVSTPHTHTYIYKRALVWTLLQILPLSERQKSFRQNTAAYFAALPFEWGYWRLFSPFESAHFAEVGERGGSLRLLLAQSQNNKCYIITATTTTTFTVQATREMQKCIEEKTGERKEAYLLFWSCQNGLVSAHEAETIIRFVPHPDLLG